MLKATTVWASALTISLATTLFWLPSFAQSKTSSSSTMTVNETVSDRNTQRNTTTSNVTEQRSNAAWIIVLTLIGVTAGLSHMGSASRDDESY